MFTNLAIEVLDPVVVACDVTLHGGVV